MTPMAFAGVGTAISSGSTVTVDAFDICRKVTNPGPGTRMVFTGTQQEWQSFINHPNGLTMDTCAPPCSGALVGGFCWYLGGKSKSCTTVCSGLGMDVDMTGTRDFAGSGGTKAHCQAVMDAVKAPVGPVQDSSCNSGAQHIGCSYFTTVKQVSHRCVNAETTADGKSSYMVRVCACK
jgi:hypothetical protein